MLRGVIDRENDAQAAYALMWYAADKKLGTADTDARQEALAGAVAALDDADRKSLKEGFAAIHPMVSDVLVLDPKNYNEDRYVPFEAAGLREEVSSLAAGNEIEKYSAARLCEILAAVIA